MKRIVLLMLVTMLLIPMSVSCAPKDDKLGVTRSSLVEPDGWVYYSNADGIYKIRENCEDKTLVLDKTVLKFQIYNNRIYYITYKEGASSFYSIYSCKTDGSDDKLVCDTLFKVHSFKRMQIVDGWFYVGIEKDAENINQYKLYRVKIDGTETEKISHDEDDLWDYSIDGDWIYYETLIIQEDEGGLQLWRMQLDGTNKQQVMQGFGMAIDYTETEIFYVDLDDDILYAVPYFSTEKRKVAETGCIVWFVKVIDDWVYYRDAGDFYKVRTDGSDHTRIPADALPESKKRISVIDNWLVYFSVGHRYYGMIRIRDTYNTDTLVNYIIDDIAAHLNEGTSFEIEVRKYEG